MKNDTLEKDLKTFLSIYSKFERINIPRKKYLILRGDIDVCDINGNYFKTFEVDILIDHTSYPYTVPLVRENSKLIKREDDWHISNDGLCCLDIDHKLIEMSQRGIAILKFYQDIIYPFFCNTVFKQLYKNYANGEYPHEFEGVQNFYKSELNLDDPELILKILQKITLRELPGRNQPCVCGKPKFKKCKSHYTSIQYLKSLPRRRILLDLGGFEEKLLGQSKNRSSVKII